ncbi:MAG: hypothetical protein A3B74_00910 [Candidatus Kerfeldbacteria bacterium RIFCSPHIGHO2_02_FULL_42_14]|uniref:Uncharacterized protein n=1 Tax=Candidatus Kerfeldbacteria bacterium RIFCSPHIGHO2_02_FULL_42_14 TaxID=1798540 RepID=A0A1G2ARW2_9BACT|nr:MAG: hypothetical protein A3B74_00910 [Candidatus Kerfeldbacteria bacterium RIFCSPHIGHO2_02_FULL_42_14]OGY81913.1 MAG: hypothetical protein A3E60_00990 [Candidatus Kerfeldbacteria bacterium RIFCSPHIGHO2_12_FULL_42_13]OGY83452.1 MAG: hypothetical protein A3I91_02265 [Candidatus Kerfeldbacteria bacterium RIFCSPLOWO2_02_FULL_42_19]OGY87022.1 MAG: hypothetical protein A3G01_01945 [Candidatus Kerfeldbacteria bacterium RIFCSPLOWO2_12_FULL_43_9]
MNKKIFLLALFVFILAGVFIFIFQRRNPGIIPPSSLQVASENVNTATNSNLTNTAVLLEDNLNEALDAVDIIEELETQ